MDSFASKVLNAVVKMILILAPKIYTCGGYFSRSDNPGKEGDVRLERSQELLVHSTNTALAECRVRDHRHQPSPRPEAGFGYLYREISILSAC